MRHFFKSFYVILLTFALHISCSSDDGAQVVNLQDLTVSLDENPANGDSVGTVQSDLPTTNFSISSQSPAGALGIDATTGELTIADASIFDFEANPMITASVTADNAANPAIVTIDLNDLFESTTPGNSNTEFVIGSDAYVTPKAYLLVDDASIDMEYDREFTFVFTDGDIVEDASNEIAFETTTTVFTKVTCNLIATKPTLAETPFFIWDPQTNPNGFVSIVMSGNNYSRYGVSNFTNTMSVGSQTFGQPADGTLHNHTALPQGSGTSNLLTINARTFDLNTMTGTIDCSYSYVDNNGVTVSGVFVGSYEILTAF
ncbi:cadherin repeat domain-containing protein [Maribacter algicola]|uniref:Cadherin repeat domain-containing protein n=1 Tax=Meishania litoralis TaxID=3434685 RepID=A0ACC7LGQ1_9FLAO